MNRPLALLVTAAVLLCSVTAARADEAPETQLEFARKLREKGYADLALELLDKLRKAPPARIADLLPLESARTRIALARQKEPAQRSALFADARKELETFIQKNAASPQAKEARLEIARLISNQGLALLSQANRQEDDKAAADLRRRAEEYFTQAGTELEKALGGVTEKLDKIQLQFEIGKNLLDRAQARPFDRKRAELVEQARKILSRVEDEAIENNRNPNLHLSRAWLVKCFQEGDDPKKANLYTKAILSETVAEAIPGQRLAWYFKIAFIPRDITITKLDNLGKLKLIQKECRDWLRTFAAYRNTPEGYAVRFELANAYLKEAQGISKDPRAPKAAVLYNLAQKELATLATSDNDYTEKASELNLAISFHRINEKTPIDELADFDACYLRARFEMYQAQRAKTAEDRRAHLRRSVAAFQNGLQVVDDRTPFAQVVEARYYLTYLYQLAGDPYRAAIMGESLGRANPSTRRSPTAAGYALQAYANIATASKLPGDAERVRELARYILVDHAKTWQDEPVTQVARYQLAVLALLEEKHLDAIGLLEQIAPNYGGYLYSQAQLVLTAAAGRRKAQDPKTRQEFLNRALAALGRMPKLPDDADTQTAQMYFAAQVQKGNFLYGAAFDDARTGKLAEAAKKYAALGAFQVEFKQTFDKHASRLPAEAQADFAAALAQLERLARYGVAQSEYRAAQYDAVLAPKATGEVVAEMTKLAKGNGPIRVKNHALVGEILGLAMRANVQKGNIPAAKDILALLRRLAGDAEGGEGGQAGAALQTLVLELKTQVRDLKARKLTRELDATVKNFSQFLDELAKQPGSTTTREGLVFLAGCYASLEKYAEAAKLYAQVPEPKVDPKKKEFTPQENKELQDYWLMQVNRGRALRLGKQLPEAKKVLEAVVNDPLGRGKFLAEKELIHLLEDQKLFGSAITAWSKFMVHPQMKAALKALPSKTVEEQDKIKTLYFECYYQYTWCHLMYGKNHALEARQKDFIQRAADKIVRVEQNADAWRLVGEDFRQLLRSEPRLYAAYLELGGKEKTLKAAGK